MHADFVDLDSSIVSSKNGAATVQGTKKTNLTQSSVESLFSATVAGGHVGLDKSKVISKEGDAVVSAQSSANIDQSRIAGRRTLIDGGRNLILTLSTLTGAYNRFTGSNINADSVNTTGDTHFNAEEKVGIKDLNANGNVLVDGKTIVLSGDNTAHSLSAEGDHITHEGDAKIRDNLSLKAKTVEQLGKTHVGKNTTLEATEHYEDAAESSNEAGETLSLIAENNRGFKGRQKADIAVIKVKDMNLLQLLNQTKARETYAQLKETDVNIEGNAVVNTTLHLWARNLTNKARLTVNGDFMAHIQGMIMNQGIIEGNSVSLEASQIIAETTKKQVMVPGGYMEVLDPQAAFHARTGDLTLESKDFFHARNVRFEAKINVTLKSSGKLYLGSQQTSSDVSTEEGRHRSRVQTTTHHKTQVISGGNSKALSADDMVFEGVAFNAGGNVHAKSETTFTDKGVYDDFQSDSSSTKRRHGRKSTRTVHESSNIFNPNSYQAGGDTTLLESEGNNRVQAPVFSGHAKAIVRSNQGRVDVDAGISTTSRHEQRSKKNLLWQSNQTRGYDHQTVETVKDYTQGGFSVFGARGVKIDIKQQGSLAQSLDLLEQNPATAWVKNLRNNPSVNWNLIEEEHKKWNKKAQGLTAEGAALLALAVTVATWGAGSAIALGVSGFVGGGTLGSIAGSAASAGFGSLVSQASISLVNRQGNIGKVIQDLSSSQNLKGLGISMG
ncbi:MAG TPA: DUF637 domain-containing protein, partial [Alphaproteobacteria bacterium]|nr:DUF637 domain-containing protein [Alphaproteobacteria bacterium]